MRLTVSDLIEKLLQMPQDAEFFLDTKHDYDSLGNVYEDEDGDVIIEGEDRI